MCWECYIFRMIGILYRICASQEWFYVFKQNWSANLSSAGCQEMTTLKDNVSVCKNKQLFSNSDMRARLQNINLGNSFAWNNLINQTKLTITINRSYRLQIQNTIKYHAITNLNITINELHCSILSVFSKAIH